MTAPPPRENATLIGHAAAEAAMQAALAGSRLHHAWLITGPDGVGKATLAYRFARRLLAGGASLAMASTDPVFRRVAAGTHADLLTVEREWDEKKKRLKKQIAVDSVRDIPRFLQLTPAEGGWRVVIIDGAEDVNAASANALLKVLEEPPARAVLILVCSAPGRLLPTIRSRCRRLALSPLGEADMAQVLTRYLPTLDAQARQTLIALAEGSPGRALALVEDGGLALHAMVEEVLAAPTFPLLRAYEFSDKLREQAAFETFMGLLRRALARAVVAYARGVADAAEARLIETRPIAAWGEIAERLGRLTEETEALNLDRRQAVVAGLALLQAP
jgi:DNA polymerase-3 subunit delta'